MIEIYKKDGTKNEEATEAFNKKLQGDIKILISEPISDGLLKRLIFKGEIDLRGMIL